MRCKTLLKHCLAALTLPFFLLSNQSFAEGSGQQECIAGEPPTKQEYEQAIRLGYDTQVILEDLHTKHGDKVVLIARVGSKAPETRFAKRIGDFWHHTHAGIAYRNHSLGQWTVVHLLNTCNKESGIFAEGLMRFSLDKPHKYENAIGRLQPQLQHRLEELIVHKQLGNAFHAGPGTYSSVSSPYNLKYQNSNEYILTTLVAAMMPDNKTYINRQQAMNYLWNSPLRHQFEPEHTKVSFIERIGKSFGLGAGNASLDDHSSKERSKGRLEMVSVGSLFNFLAETDMLTGTMKISL